jgi:ERCC4-type nuclease
LNHAGSEAGYVLTPEDAREDLREMREKERPYPDVEIERAALPVADYSLSGWTEHVGIERKELNDLISCLMNGNRDRFEREFVNFDSTSWRP